MSKTVIPEAPTPGLVKFLLVLGALAMLFGLGVLTGGAGQNGWNSHHGVPPGIEWMAGGFGLLIVLCLFEGVYSLGWRRHHKDHNV